MSAEEREDDSIYVERGNFEQVPNALWQHPDDTKSPIAVSPAAVVMYLALSNRGGKETRGIPRRSRLAKDMGVSLRTVDARMDELVEKGWLLITPRFREDGDKQQASNHYRLLWTPITSPEDPRLTRQRSEVERFEAEMEARQETNAKKAEATGRQKLVSKARSVRAASYGAPRAENCAGVRPAETPETPRAESCTGGAQDSAPQEPDLLGLEVPSEPLATAAAVKNRATTTTTIPEGERPTPKAETGRTVKARTRITPDWQPSEGCRTWAAGAVTEAGVEVALTHELEQFRDYHDGKGTLAANWDATFRTWVRNAIQRAPRIGSGGQRPSRFQSAGEREMERHRGYGEGDAWAEAFRASRGEQDGDQ